MTDPKEIDRRKANRSEARKNLAARREALIHLEKKNATEAQVNATVKVILMRSAKTILLGENEIDKGLQELTKSHPRLRNW